jgi:DNA helicase-2/ATP-dependent DNA helicase PcrA
MAERELEPEVISILSIIRNKQHFLLSGGAGCGKTFSLVSLLKEISKVEPKAKIACITYTNAAALEIRNRTHMDNLHVSTIHDFLWMNISQFQKELKNTLVEMVNEPTSGITNPQQGELFSLDSEILIQYKEHTRLAKGEISHDEVIKISNMMFKRYTKLCKIVCSKYKYIFVDEYQDTSPLVIDILLSSLQKVPNPSIIGFFGDSMQAIYDEGVGDINNYVESGIVKKIEKKQNRRNPKKIIELGNQLRTDGLMQEPSKDIDAPNMENGKIKEGAITFLYGSDIAKVYSYKKVENWDFSDSLRTKELRLTHNLIAGEGGFNELMELPV